MEDSFLLEHFHFSTDDDWVRVNSLAQTFGPLLLLLLSLFINRFLSTVAAASYTCHPTTTTTIYAPAQNNTKHYQQHSQKSPSNNKIGKVKSSLFIVAVVVVDVYSTILSHLVFVFIIRRRKTKHLKLKSQPQISHALIIRLWHTTECFSSCRRYG